MCVCFPSSTIVSDNGLRHSTSSSCLVSSSVYFEEGEGVFPFSLNGSIFVRLRFVSDEKIKSMLNFSPYSNTKTPVRNPDLHTNSTSDPLFVWLRNMTFFAGPKADSTSYYILDTDKGEVLEHEGRGELNVVQSNLEFPCRLLVVYKSIGSGMMTVDSTVGLPVLDLTANMYENDNIIPSNEILESYEL